RRRALLCRPAASGSARLAPLPHPGPPSVLHPLPPSPVSHPWAPPSLLRPRRTTRAPLPWVRVRLQAFSSHPPACARTSPAIHHTTSGGSPIYPARYLYTTYAGSLLLSASPHPPAPHCPAAAQNVSQDRDIPYR